MAKLSSRYPLDPWSARMIKKAPCPRGIRLRELLSDLPPNVVALRPEERSREIEFGMAYCVRTCGGCELTEGWSPE